ncbi:MAG TPA: hypothetical protein VHC22_32645 [Pirellulales bacterium]|nr:hypothetical protein [Pirellulales bacterium]
MPTKRFQFGLRGLFWAMTLMGIGCLVLQFVIVGVPYWFHERPHQKGIDRLNDLKRLETTLAGKLKQDAQRDIWFLEMQLSETEPAIPWSSRTEVAGVFCPVGFFIFFIVALAGIRLWRTKDDAPEQVRIGLPDEFKVPGASCDLYTGGPRAPSHLTSPCDG